MKINVKVVPNAKRNLIKQEENVLKVYLTAPAVDGKANKSLIDKLADHFNVKKSNINILAGETSRNKIVEID